MTLPDIIFLFFCVAFCVWAYIHSRIKATQTKEKQTMNAASVIAAINAALCKGTRILAFEYHGKTRNVLVGAKWMESPVRWGVKVNRALIQHNGETYLHAQVHNESGSPKIAKIFNVKEIENLRGKV